MSETRTGEEVWRVMAHVFAREIDLLDRQVNVLARNHATTKASGPAHTAKHLEQLARGLIGPNWRSWS